MLGRVFANPKEPRAWFLGLTSFDWADFLPGVMAGVMVYLWTIPIVVLLQEAVALSAARFLEWMGTWKVLEELVSVLPVDRIYAMVALRTLSNIHGLGISVGGSTGDWLHYWWPSIFSDPRWAYGGAWSSAVILDGSSLASQLIVRVTAAAVILLLGMLLMWVGSRRTSIRQVLLTRPDLSWLVFLGILLQARAIFQLLTLYKPLMDLESQISPLVFTKIYVIRPEIYELAAPVFSPLFAFMSFLLIVGGLYSALWVTRALVGFFSRGITLRIRYSLRWSDFTLIKAWSKKKLVGLRQGWPINLGIITLVGLVILSPVDDFAAGETNYDYQALPESLTSPLLARELVLSSEPVLSDQTARITRIPVPTDRSGSNIARGMIDDSFEDRLILEALSPSDARSLTAQTLSPLPSVVTVTGSNRRYIYKVNGVAQTIRGIGYNAMYDSQGMSDEDRDALYERDFQKMRAMGINTILGWDEGEFDEVTLQKAWEHGLGVVMPFDLDPYGAFDDPAYRSSVTERVKSWVNRFKDQPAVRMWGLGNEVLHKLHKISRQREDTFVRFYLELIDGVRQLDPSHPIVYREAEDVFIEPFKSAMAKDRVKRSWFIYGMNIFTFRIEQVMENWPKKEFDVPILISEFGPTGMNAKDRPGAYRRMWGAIKKRLDMALGGFVYTWSIKGPEPLDRVFGLLNERGEPVDGTVDALAEQFVREKVEEIVSQANGK